MRRPWFYCGFPLAMTGLLGGCKSDEPEESRTSVEIFSWWTKAGEAQALKQVIDAHEKAYPHVDVVNTAVETERAGNDARQELGARMDAGKPPDAFQQTGSLSDWLTRGQGIRPLDELFASKGWDTAISSFLLPGVKVNGQLYAVPTNVHSQNYLFYNKQVFSANNLSPPTSLDELIGVCQKLKAAGITPMGMSYQGWIMRIVFDAVAVASPRGGAFLRELYAGLVDEATLSSTVNTFDELVKLYSNSDAANAIGWDVLGERLANGEIAMFVHADWLKGQLDTLGKIPGTDYDVVLFPGGSNGTAFLFNADSFALPSGAKNSEGAEDFLSTFLDPEVQATFAKTKGACPAVQNVEVAGLDSVAKALCRGIIGASTRLLVQEKIDSILEDAYVTGKGVADIKSAIAAAYTL